MESQTQTGVPVHAAVAGLAPALRITPETVPVDFGWNQDFENPQEWGQDFQVTYVHGGKALRPGDVVFIRANFIVFDPSPLGSRLSGGTTSGEDIEGQENLLRLYLSAWKSGALGLQVVHPRQANYVELAEEATSARLKMGPPLIANPQFRVIPVTVLSGTVQPGEHFTLSVRRACSSALRNVGGICTNANEHAFVAAVGRRTRQEGEGDAREWSIVEELRGGMMLPLAASVVNAVLPSQVQAGVETHLRVAVLDDMDNVVHGWRGTLQLSCTDPQAVFPAAVTLDAAEDRGATRIPVTLRTPGVHRFTVRALDADFATGPVQVTEEAPARRVLWGDYHLHSWRCDGTGAPENLLAYARGAAFMDWGVLTSHDAPLWPFAGAVAWDDIAKRVEDAQQDGFVTLPAFEWTSTASGEEGFETNGDGHHIVLARDWTLLLEPFLPTWTDSRTDNTWKLHRELIRRDAGAREPGVMVIPHDLLCNNWWEMNAECPDCDERITPEEQERYVPLAQVYSPLHGNHESPQESGALPENLPEGTVVPAAWRPHSRYYGQPDELAGYVNGLKYGGVYGVAAGADSHAGRPGSFVFGGLTAVVADDPSRDGIFRALQARHTYATSGHRLLMELSHARADGGTAIMGDRVEYEAGTAEKPALAWRVVSPLPIQRVRLVRVRGALPGETLRQPVEGDPVDPWRFVTYLGEEEYGEEGTRPTEASGVITDGDFSPEWPYVSYFLVVEHENTRRHARDVVSTAAEDPGYHRQDRGWTSPIFFRRRGAALPLDTCPDPETTSRRRGRHGRG